MSAFKKIGFRISEIVLLLFITVTAVFFIMHAAGDSPSIINNANIDQSVKESFNRKYGLDQSSYMQLLLFWKNIFTGSLGVSLSTHLGVEINTFIWPKLGRSLAIGVLGTVVGIAFGILMGVLIGLRPRGYLDKFFQILIAIFIAIPTFITALIFVIIAASTGFPIIYEDANPLTWLLPVFSLAIPTSMFTAKYIRTNLLKSLDTQYARLAQAKGILPRNIIVRHLLKESLFSIATFFPGVILGSVVSAILFENIFSIPGLGRLYVDSIQGKDYNVLLVITSILAFLTAISVIMRDIIYQIINPQLRRKGVN